jgi:hypothetical protein
VTTTREVLSQLWPDVHPTPTTSRVSAARPQLTRAGCRSGTEHRADTSIYTKRETPPTADSPSPPHRPRGSNSPSIVDLLFFDLATRDSLFSTSEIRVRFSAPLNVNTRYNGSDQNNGAISPSTRRALCLHRHCSSTTPARPEPRAASHRRSRGDSSTDGAPTAPWEPVGHALRVRVRSLDEGIYISMMHVRPASRVPCVHTMGSSALDTQSRTVRPALFRRHPAKKTNTFL